MWAKRKAAILEGRRGRFAAPFYANHRADVTYMTGCAAAAVLATGAVALVTLLHAFVWRDHPGAFGAGELFRAALALSLFFLALAAVIAGFRDQFALRVLPYFERPVGAIDTWLAGEDLLWNSRALDETALRCGVTPLSAFASGDDLVPGQVLRWFEPAEALRTTERLLEADQAGAFPPGALEDLRRLRDALKRADEQGVRFGLLVREGSSCSGHEMDLRKGSFF